MSAATVDPRRGGKYRLPSLRSPSREAARLGLLLLITFAFAIASFLSSQVVVETRARGIGGAATAVATDAMPAIEHLARARTSLRHLETLVDDVIDDLSRGRDPSEHTVRYQHARESVAREWSAYTELPATPDEQALWVPVVNASADMQSALDLVLARAKAGDPESARRVRTTRLRPAIDRLDASLEALLTYNAAHAGALSSRIVELRSSFRSWAFVLDGLSALLTAIAALLVVRMVQRFANVMSQRVDDLQHFAGRVAHDVRSPLTTVGLALGIAKRSAQIDPKTQTVLDQGVSTLQRVGQLVDGLLLFARAGGPPPEGEVRASVDKVVQEVVEEMRPTAAAAGIEIDFVAMAPSIVACNPGVLTSIVSNLLGNAIKYMGDAKERRVTVRIRDLDTNVRIEVQDTGPGLAPELQDRIFEPYVRGRASGTQGFGLGLATVRRLAEAHGGAAGLDKNVPVGSLFWVELPKATARKASLTAHS